MKFPRNARIFRGHLEIAPFASVFFLLVIFISLSSLMYTPGVKIQLPVAADLPGTDKPSVSVAVGSDGRLYYANKWIPENEFKVELTNQVRKAAGKPLVLVVHADQQATYNMLLGVTLAARDAGITEALLATLPNPAAPGGKR
jgi:biopolymer transport protein ExbD